MEFPITLSIPHGITPDGDTGPFTPATVTVTFRDFSTAALDVIAVEGTKRVVLDFAGSDARPEDVISADVRETCPESGSGSSSASASASASSSSSA